MDRGVLEYKDDWGFWKKSFHNGLDDLFERALMYPDLFERALRYPGSYEFWTYRYRVGKRAVMLWPESEMGKVVDL